MKLILYAGAALMIGAGIYGFVDYKQSSRKKEFTNMYSEEKLKSSVVPANTQSIEANLKTVVVNKKNQSVSKQQSVKKQNVIEAVNPNTNTNDEILKTNDAGEMKNSYISGTPSKQTKLLKKTKKKKTIKTHLFSRAPLRDEDEELPLPPPVETKKN